MRRRTEASHVADGGLSDDWYIQQVNEDGTIGIVNGGASMIVGTDGKVREKTDGGQDWFKVYKGIFDNSTFIPGTALSFVETKPGKLMAMGGSPVWKASTYSAQRSLAWDVNFGNKAISRTGKVLGGAGLLLTAGDMYYNGVNTSNSLDAAMGIVSFIPGGGWIAGGYNRKECRSVD